jgi:hypothetical protein
MSEWVFGCFRIKCNRHLNTLNVPSEEPIGDRITSSLFGDAPQVVDCIMTKTAINDSIVVENSIVSSSVLGGQRAPLCPGDDGD